ncbi:F0F1 ATP synthase subunit B [Mesonia sp. K7]|uniref:F0F1 ATP synthase subunit B n=1 Tax=Mesonia sp. K7 TaxID=2218606 RepID=UPI000DA9AAC4|nr:F0F1 ATP synthase subunit B [Mesonia sp. K7]PZD79080.1 F0F1 ATP synthase subunit B [Mesonia sp. K7]
MDKLIEQFSFGLFFWQLLLFLLLVLLLRKFAWRPILNSVEKRETGIKDALASAENAKKEMENLQADNQKLLKEAREERDSMLKEARQIKEKMIADASSEAEQKANSIIASAQEAIKMEKQAALNELKKEVAALSIDIAEKVLNKELSSKNDQMQLVDTMLEDVKLN